MKLLTILALTGCLSWAQTPDDSKPATSNVQALPIPGFTPTCASPFGSTPPVPKRCRSSPAATASAKAPTT
jgi:hypothetical protein